MDSHFSKVFKSFVGLCQKNRDSRFFQAHFLKEQKKCLVRSIKILRPKMVPRSRIRFLIDWRHSQVDLSTPSRSKSHIPKASSQLTTKLDILYQVNHTASGKHTLTGHDGAQHSISNYTLCVTLIHQEESSLNRLIYHNSALKQTRNLDYSPYISTKYYKKTSALK